MGTDSAISSKVARMLTNGLKAPSPRLFSFSSLLLWKDSDTATEKPQKNPNAKLLLFVLFLCLSAE